jgi:uncharacterized membrane protein YkvA (DUF1232 family)
MSTTQWLMLGVGAVVALYLLFVGVLYVVGRRDAARAFAGFIPDCIVLFRRLLADDRVPRRYKVMLAGLIGYLALPLDIVPDFIPVAGQLDDAIIVALVLRISLRGAGPSLITEHWPGPPSSLALILRLARATPDAS